jgi:hypothetical protein
VLELGIALLVTGLYWAFMTWSGVSTPTEVAESVEFERATVEQMGVLSAKVRQIEVMRRHTGRHPVLMRLPTVVLIGVGAVLIGVGWN